MTAEVEVIPAGRRGPETKYSPDMCTVILDIARTGGHIAKMLVELGVCKDTFYRWQKQFPEFKEAVERAKDISQAFYEELGLRGLTGDIPHFNATVYALVMNNKFGDDYRRGSGSNTEVTINNNNHTVQLTADEITQKISQKLDKLKSLGVDLSVMEGIKHDDKS